MPFGMSMKTRSSRLVPNSQSTSSYPSAGTVFSSSSLSFVKRFATQFASVHLPTTGDAKKNGLYPAHFVLATALGTATPIPRDAFRYGLELYLSLIHISEPT